MSAYSIPLWTIFTKWPAPSAPMYVQHGTPSTVAAIAVSISATCSYDSRVPPGIRLGPRSAPSSPPDTPMPRNPSPARAAAVARRRVSWNSELPPSMIVSPGSSKAVSESMPSSTGDPALTISRIARGGARIWTSSSSVAAGLKSPSSPCLAMNSSVRCRVRLYTPTRTPCDARLRARFMPMVASPTTPSSWSSSLLTPGIMPSRRSTTRGSESPSPSRFRPLPGPPSRRFRGSRSRWKPRRDRLDHRHGTCRCSQRSRGRPTRWPRAPRSRSTWVWAPAMLQRGNSWARHSCRQPKLPRHRQQSLPRPRPRRSVTCVLCSYHAWSGANLKERLESGVSLWFGTPMPSPSPLWGEGLGVGRESGRELQAADPGQVQPVPAAAFHDPHLHLAAGRASDDHARRIHVDLDLTDRMHLEAARAGALGGCHLHREDLAQQAGDRVAIELQIGLLNGHGLNLLWVRTARS